jgi:hypothetical protein
MVDVRTTDGASSRTFLGDNGAGAGGAGVLAERTTRFAHSDALLELVHETSTHNSDVSDGGVKPM